MYKLHLLRLTQPNDTVGAARDINRVGNADLMMLLPLLCSVCFVKDTVEVSIDDDRDGGNNEATSFGMKGNGSEVSSFLGQCPHLIYLDDATEDSSSLSISKEPEEYYYDNGNNMK